MKKIKNKLVNIFEVIVVFMNEVNNEHLYVSRINEKLKQYYKQIKQLKI